MLFYYIKSYCSMKDTPFFLKRVMLGEYEETGIKGLVSLIGARKDSSGLVLCWRRYMRVGAGAVSSNLKLKFF